MGLTFIFKFFRLLSFGMELEGIARSLHQDVRKEDFVLEKIIKMNPIQPRIALRGLEQGTVIDSGFVAMGCSESGSSKDGRVGLYARGCSLIFIGLYVVVFLFKGSD